MRILVTNDDGIDSIGLHVLARAMRPFGDVVIAAPDQEYSGYSAAIGSIHLMKPEVHTAHVDGIDEAWAVSGAPALCAMFGGLGVFGDIDLIVSGINPGANVGRSVYYSGTVGACVAGRNMGISGVAVSQSVDNWGVEGQAWDDMLADQQWQGAADVAAKVVESLVADLPVQPVVANINVPNVQASEMNGWRRTDIGVAPPRAMAKATLVPKVGHEGAFNVEMSWGDAIGGEQRSHDDTGAIMEGYASITWLGRYPSETPGHPAAKAAESALSDFLG